MGTRVFAQKRRQLRTRTGSVFGAFAAGLPELVTPGPGDRKFNAEQVAARGAGLAVAAKRITAADLVRLIIDDGLTAAEVRAEMNAMPAPAELVAHLARHPHLRSEDTGGLRCVLALPPSRSRSVVASRHGSRGAASP